MNITDMNDNAPVWSTKELHKEFAESEREGMQSFKDLEMATDRDTGRNGEVNYTITGTLVSGNSTEYSWEYPHGNKNKYIPRNIPENKFPSIFKILLYRFLKIDSLETIFFISFLFST